MPPGAGSQLPLLAGAAVLALSLALCTPPARAFSFTLDRKECFFERVPRHQSTMVGYVVSRYERYWSREESEHLVDVKVLDPSGQEVASSLSKSRDELYFWSHEEGLYQVCVINRVPQHAHVNMDFLEYYQFMEKKGDTEVVRDDHADTVNSEIARLRGDLASAHHDVWFSFYLAQQHIDLDRTMNWRLIWKTLLQALLLVGCSVAQVYLLRRLIESRMFYSIV